VVPSTGANEMDLDELISHIERDQVMKAQSYVTKANGWVDPSSLAHHRYVVLTIEHQSETGAPVCSYYIRIDRRAERHLSVFKFVRRAGKAKSSDRVVLSYDQDRLLAPSKRKEVECALRLDEPFRLDRLGLMLGAIRAEFAYYRLTKNAFGRRTAGQWRRSYWSPWKLRAGGHTSMANFVSLTGHPKYAKE